MESATANVNTKMIRVAVCGGLGKMGREVVKTVLEDPELTLAGVADHNGNGQALEHVFKVDTATGQLIENDLQTVLKQYKPEVCVDFTHPDAVFDNTLRMIDSGCRPVIGTTGLTPNQLEKIDQALREKKIGGMVVPNFAIGAVLMMKFAREAAKYFDHAEIIEMHHNKKADAPSGTAIKTAELMRESREKFGVTNAPEKETYAGARGGEGPAEIRIHSVRLPGYVAHQEVLLGAPGQILSIRHDSMDRSSFMPGVALACKKVMTFEGLIYGLEHIL
ncbi:MAG TPA: 4-hydroxy-tetrahydrodipicolinate reductase [Oculatellaceae cyanobacterium]|jgi:4-hydroxy-tetrahydrodipicolinate reductase